MSAKNKKRLQARIQGKRTKPIFEPCRSVEGSAIAGPPGSLISYSHLFSGICSGHCWPPATERFRVFRWTLPNVPSGYAVPEVYDSFWGHAWLLEQTSQIRWQQRAGRVVWLSGLDDAGNVPLWTASRILASILSISLFSRR